MSALTIFTGNTSPSIEDVIRVNGQPFDLTDCTVKFRMRPDAGSVFAVDAAAVIVDAVAGSVRYDWADGDTDTADHYHAWWQVTLASGALQDSPDFYVAIIDHASIEGITYATEDELFRILSVRQPKEPQSEAAARVLAIATGEINAEINLVDGDTLTAGEREICSQVCLDRAADLWRHTESVPGVLGGLDDAVQMTPVRYSWERYAQRLASVKKRWGLA